MTKSFAGRMLAFTALFAVLAGFVFAGTWSPDMVPVMPDCVTSFPVEYVKDWCREWLGNGKFVPTDLLVFLVPPYVRVELQYVLALYLAACGMLFFMRGRGLDFWPAAFSGLFLAFSGYWITLFSAGHLGWFRWMSFGVFVFGFIDRAVEKGRAAHWIMLGATLAWASFYQSDLWLLFSVFSFLYFVYRLATVRPSPRRLFAGGALALAVFAAIGWPSFRSAIVTDLAGREEQIKRGETIGLDAVDEKERRWIFTTNWSMPPEDTLEFAVPRVHGDTSCPMTLAIASAAGKGTVPYTGRLGRPLDAASGNYRQHSLYVGFATCILAAAAVICAFFRRERRADTVFFAVLLVLFWILSMGRYVECVYRAVFALPFGDSIRAPVKWHHLTEFCFAALAGFGFASLWETRGRFRAAVRAGLVVFSLCGLASLAHVASLYCAPHKRDVRLVQIPEPVPSNPAKADRMKRELKRFGYEALGVVMLPARLADGTVREFPFFLAQTPAPRPQLRPAPGADWRIVAPAVVSALSTIACLAFLVSVSIVRRRRED